MAFERRKYQVDAAKAAYKNRLPILILAPNGSGKTIIIAKMVHLARKASKKRVRILIISHRKEIILQTVKSLKSSNIHAAILMGQETTDDVAQADVIVASINTLSRRGFPKADIVIIDEAHRAVAKTYVKLVGHYSRRGVKIIGLTATPYRLSGQGLGDVFDEMYEATKISDILGKCIMKPVVFSAAPEHLPDLIGLSTSRGDFKVDDLVRRMNKDGLVGNIVDNAKDKLGKRRTVIFCCSTAHSKKVMRSFIKAGLTAEHVDYKTPNLEREAILDRFKKGKTQFLCCCFLLSEGWDVPTCEAVIMARPTRSLSLFIQMAGRCNRMSRRKPIILDHACNTVMHDLPWIDRDWDLEGKGMGAPNASVGKVRICSKCYCVNEPGTKLCQACKTDLVKHQIRSPTERKDIELVEWSKIEKLRRKKKIEDFAKSRGFSKEWVKQVGELWDVG